MQTCYYSPSFDSNTSLFLFTLFSQQCKPVIIQCFHSNANLLLFTVFTFVIIHSVFKAIQTCYYSLCFHSNANLLLFAVSSQQCKPVIIHSNASDFTAIKICYYSQCFQSNANLLLFLLLLFSKQQCKPVIKAMQTCYYSPVFSVFIHTVFTAMQTCYYSVFSLQTCYYSQCFHSNANLILFKGFSQQ